MGDIPAAAVILSNLQCWCVAGGAVTRVIAEELSAMLGQSFSVDKTNQGYLTITGMIEAVKAKNGDSVQRLLNAGANPLIKDPWGRTALDLARANGDSCVGLIEAALKRQAETEIKAPPKALVSP